MYFKRSNHKYSAKKVTSLCHYGFSHRSQLERAVCDIVRYREMAGELTHVAHEKHITVCGPDGHECPARVQYVVDFVCRDSEGNLFGVESKGFSDQKWPIKKKLFEHYGPFKLEIWQGSHANPTLTETIIPIVKPG